MSNKPKIYDITATGSTTPRDIRDRFSDVINVKDFGAVGDGQTDDTEAFEAAAEFAGGRHVYIPAGDYVLNREVSGTYYSHEEPDVPAEFITMANRAFAGNVKAIYISSEGNDKNNGKSTSTPIKTLAKAFQMMNAGTHTQYSFYLMGDAVYDVPSDIFVIGQSCPHFYSVDGSPTMRFMYKSGVGPRFYGGHVNMTGNSTTNRLKIDSAYGSLYFEGVTVGATNVDFLVPVKVVGGSFTSVNLGVTNDEDSAALIFSYTNAKISGTTFYNNPKNCAFVSAVHGTVFMGYSAVEVVNAFASDATGNFINLEHTYAKLSLSGFGSSLPSSAKALRMFSATAIMSESLYTGYQTAGFEGSDYTIFIGANILTSSALTKGSTLSIGNYYIAGCVANASKRLTFTYPLPNKLAPDVTSVTISFSSMNVRGASGYVAQGLTLSSLAEASDAKGGISTDRQSVTFYMDLATALNISNNAMISLQFAGMQLSFE